MIEARTLGAGALYSLVVFAAGLVLGVIRVMWVARLAGEAVSLALEAPIILALAWYACGWAAERMEVSPRFFERLAMGGVALAMLIGAEAAIAVFGKGRSIAEYFGDYARSAILLGLLAQLAFAVFPLLRRRRDDA